jgi:hypothetical protein
MLNNLTNFFNLIVNRKVRPTAGNDDLIALGVRDPRTPGIYQPSAIRIVDLRGQLVDGAEQTTGLTIDFLYQKVYNTATSPATGSITNNLTDAKLGVVQKIYHNSLIAPSMPAGWVLLGNGVYLPGALNIIYAEWCGGTRVEYWVTQ